MKFIYIANVLVAGWISISSVFFPKYAARTVFSGAYPETEVIRLVGCLWLAIAILSVFGFFSPLTFVPVLLLQIIYKSAWLLFAAAPAWKEQKAFPEGMALFFVIWVVVLPIVIPWKEWWQHCKNW